MTGRNVVYVVAKSPRSGASKTRLCPPLEPEQAAQLAEAFLLDTIANVAEAGCEARVMCPNAVEQSALRSLVSGAARVDIQSGSGLGAALESAFHEGLRDGFAGVAVLGSDSPTLSSDAIHQAFTALDHGTDVALGPCDDGGYYLLAAWLPYPRLFRAMPWSTDAVAALTLARCEEAGLRTHQLPTWYDVDDPPSLRRLEAELLTRPSHVAPHSRAALAHRHAASRPKPENDVTSSGKVVA